jgi:chromosome segregation and condensation protein ScpB
MPTRIERDELVRQRPGITRQEVREALGTDVDRALQRLMRIGYIRSVRSKRYASYYPIERD